MSGFSKWLLALFATPLGIFVLAALDSTMFFFFPLGIDAVVIIVSARMSSRAWLIPILATTGSVAGAALTFWMGSIIGDAGLERYAPPRRLAMIRARLKNTGAIGLAALDLIPPPFPFTAFVLAAGALEVKKTTFFVTLTLCRLLRFGVESLLAVWYGRRILGWFDSDLFRTVLTLMILAAIAISVVSIVRTFGRQSARRARA
jgi:membrane protein YqaA with SNARE-associated domain